MRTTLNKVSLIIIGILFAPLISGQISKADLDSVPIIKPKINRNIYKFYDSGDKEIQISQIKAELVHYKTNPVLRDVGNGLMTAITGFGFSSSTDVNWKISGTINCNDMLPDWIVSLFCEGYLQKDRERVQNDDGSWSVETNETNVYNWDKNSGGILMEGNDSIGLFMIIMNPREDKLLKSWSLDVLPQQPVQQSSKPKIKWEVSWKPSPGIDYGISGNFRDKSFAIIRNGTDRKVWIFLDSLLVCIFQSDLNYRGMSRKYRIMPYFLMNKNISGRDRLDLFRLAMVSKLLTNSLTPH
jgi:hypothetical protein